MTVTTALDELAVFVDRLASLPPLDRAVAIQADGHKLVGAAYTEAVHAAANEQVEVMTAAPPSPPMWHRRKRTHAEVAIALGVQEKTVTKFCRDHRRDPRPRR